MCVKNWTIWGPESEILHNTARVAGLCDCATLQARLTSSGMQAKCQECQTSWSTSAHRTNTCTDTILFLSSEVPKVRGAPKGTSVGTLGGGGRVCMRGLFILNEIFGILYFTYHLVPVLALSYKHILSLAKVRKVRYSLAEIYVKSD
jgi:hypothetical protein